MPTSEIPPLPGGAPSVIVVLQHSRLTVVENLYHQPTEGFPAMAFGDASRFSRELQSDEQPYERHRVAKETWEPLDCGWIERCGMLMVRNDEGHFSVNPTQEQRAKVARRVLVVSFGESEDAILLPPLETCRFYPADVKQMQIRCREGTARYTLYLIPE
jgi:hypothetical protein